MMFRDIIADMKFRDTKQGFVVDLSKEVIDEVCLAEIKDYFYEHKKRKRIALNLRDVEVKTHNFFEFLKDFSVKQKISVFNINSELFILFNLMKYNEYVDFYNREDDFLQNRYSLVNRNFKICA